MRILVRTTRLSSGPPKVKVMTCMLAWNKCGVKVGSMTFQGTRGWCRQEKYFLIRPLCQTLDTIRLQDEGIIRPIHQARSTRGLQDKVTIRSILQTRWIRFPQGARPIHFILKTHPTPWQDKRALINLPPNPLQPRCLRDTNMISFILKISKTRCQDRCRSLIRIFSQPLHAIPPTSDQYYRRNVAHTMIEQVGSDDRIKYQTTANLVPSTHRYVPYSNSPQAMRNTQYTSDRNLYPNASNTRRIYEQANLQNMLSSMATEQQGLGQTSSYYVPSKMRHAGYDTQQTPTSIDSYGVGTFGKPQCSPRQHVDGKSVCHFRIRAIDESTKLRLRFHEHIWFVCLCHSRAVVWRLKHKALKRTTVTMVKTREHEDPEAHQVHPHWPGTSRWLHTLRTRLVVDFQPISLVNLPTSTILPLTVTTWTSRQQISMLFRTIQQIIVSIHLSQTSEIIQQPSTTLARIQPTMLRIQVLSTTWTSPSKVDNTNSPGTTTWHRDQQEDRTTE